MKLTRPDDQEWLVQSLGSDEDTARCLADSVPGAGESANVAGRFARPLEHDDLYSRALACARRIELVNSGFNRKGWESLADFGLLRSSIPSERGGLGFDRVTTARAIEAFGRGTMDTGLIFSACAHLFAAAMPIALYGGHALRYRVLSLFCSGKWIGASAITEPEAGSDVFALKAHAKRNGRGYVLNGTKTFVTNGPVADAIVVYATTNPAHGYLGISAFIIERGTPGVTCSEAFTKSGLLGAPVGSVHLIDCYIPEENRIGPEGSGAQIFETSMQWERACLFAIYVGVMKRSLETAITYARKRKQFGKPISQNQSVAHRLVNMKLRLEAACLLLYHACSICDKGGDGTIAVALAKIAVSEAAVESGLDLIRIHGGAGLMNDARVDPALLDSVPSLIFSGTNEIQRGIVARKLGL
jgi:L-prolyl-PCP dehydrogenase